MGFFSDMIRKKMSNNQVAALSINSHAFRIPTTTIKSFSFLLLISMMIIGSSYPVGFCHAQETTSLGHNEDYKDDESIDHRSQSKVNIMDSQFDKKGNVEEDPSTLLDVFGELAKEIVTHQLIPPTDSECRWDWRYFRCEPYCTCSFQFVSGDYHFGRSCRLRSPQIHPPPNGRKYLHNNNVSSPPEGCHLPPNTWYTKALASSRSAIHLGREKLDDWERQVKEAAIAYRSEIYDKICQDDYTTDNLNLSDLKSKLSNALPTLANRMRKAACTSKPHNAEE